MQSLFSTAASLLLGEKPETAANPGALRLLDNLGYAPQPAGAASGEALHRARLLQAAAKFSRIFELNVPDAPGLVAFGAEIDPALADPIHAGSPPVSVSGVGSSVQEAFQGCVGEGIEYLSQLHNSADVLSRGDWTTQAAMLDPEARAMIAGLEQSRASADPGLSWFPVIRLADGGKVQLPADLCLRRPPGLQEFVPPFPLSTGSAAGTSWEAAALHGLLELIERDAASLWWRGGRFGCAVPASVQAGADLLLQALRAGASLSRRSWLLDITTDVGVPCIVALSCRPDGRGVAFGLASRLTLEAASRSAIFELCQIELAYAVIEAKRSERGEAALNARDRAHLQRAMAIDADQCALLRPGTGCVEQIAIDPSDKPRALQAIVRRLGELGINAYGLDLTRPRFAIPVARIIAPALQGEPSQIVTRRLADTIARTGGGAAYTGGVALI
jgi:ribosomal protein S12 methylthiotransferase accessory factor